jgi:hypothetical protein
MKESQGRGVFELSSRSVWVCIAPSLNSQSQEARGKMLLWYLQYEGHCALPPTSIIDSLPTAPRSGSLQHIFRLPARL